MNTIKFIRDNGLKSAKKVINGAPLESDYFSFEDAEVVYFKDGAYFDNDYEDWFEIYFMMPELISLSELKNLLKSVEGINNLSNFEFKGSNSLAWAQLILNHAPIDSDAYSPITKKYFYSPNILFDFDKREWVDMDRGVDLDLYQEFISIAELDQWIQDYELIYQPKCKHGYDVACLICGFGTVDGERVYRTQGAKNG